MASFKDPSRTFDTIEVIERLLEITDYLGYSPVLHIESTADIATYLDSLGFDAYTLIAHTEQRFRTNTSRSPVLPSGSRSHDTATAH